MSDLKSNLENVLEYLKEAETEARKLANQNLADTIALARGRLKQASEHPDLELVGKSPEEQHELRFNSEVAKGVVDDVAAQRALDHAAGDRAREETGVFDPAHAAAQARFDEKLKGSFPFNGDPNARQDANTDYTG